MSQDRPCRRCIKRNIGHLCHDEPREGQHRKSKSESDQTGADEATSPDNEFSGPPAAADGSLLEDAGTDLMQDNSMGLRPSSNDTMPVTNSGSIVQSTGVNGNSQSRKSVRAC